MGPTNSQPLLMWINGKQPLGFYFYYIYWLFSRKSGIFLFIKNWFFLNIWNWFFYFI